MENLNDDCLCYIFEYLPLKDQLAVTYVLERFRSLMCTIIWPPHFRNVSIMDERFNQLEKDEFMDFFQMISPSIVKLVIHVQDSDTFASYLGRHIRRPDLSFYFHQDYPKMRDFHCYNSSLTNGMMRILVNKCAELRSLHLTNCNYITGEYLGELRKLDLLIAGGTNITSTNLMDILRNTKLRTLLIQQVNNGHDKTILQAPKCLLLQTLCLFNVPYFGLELAAASNLLPHLRDLEINYLNYSSIDVQKMWSETCAISFVLPKNLCLRECNYPEISKGLVELIENGGKANPNAIDLKGLKFPVIPTILYKIR